MAELDLNSLFGQDPRLLQQAMDMQMAKASPEERLYMMGAQGGRALGQGIGSLFGVDVQDPMMKKAAALRALASEYDTTTAEGMAQFAQAASKIDPRAGFLAAQQVRNMQAKQASIAKDEAAAQASLSGRTPADIQKAQRIAALKKAIPAYKQVGDTDTVKMLEDELAALTPEAKINYGEEANRVAVATFGKPFAELTQDQARQVDQTLEKRGITKAQAGRINVAPEIKMAPDIVGAVSAVDKATEKEVAMMDSAALAKQLINQTTNSNNSQTWEAARTTIAKAVGENKLSNEDIRRTGVDPRLVQGALDWVNKKIEGVPNQDIQRQLFVLGSVLENNAKARYDAKVSRYRGAAQAAGFPGQPSTYFPTAAERNQAPQSNVRDWNSLK